MTSRASIARCSPVVPAVLAVVLAGALTGCGASVPSEPRAIPAPPPGAPAPSSANRYPGEVFDLANWYLTLPTGTPEHPDTVHQPDLATYSSPFFRLDDSRTGVVFTANAGGATTKGSKYPRSELREMAGTQEASWSNVTGTHTLSLHGAVLSLPPVKPEVVVAQIHDEDDDVLLVRVEEDELLVEWDDGDSQAILDPAYRLGAAYDLRIVAMRGRVEVYLGGERKAEIPRSGSGWYFKAGCYLQSNVDRGDAADAVSEVVISQLTVSHT